MALRTVGVKLAAEVSSYVAGMRTAKTDTKDFVGELDRAAKAGQLDAVADQAGRMGLALAAGFAVAVGAAARFDKQMSEVSAVSNASAEDLERLRQAALQAGKDTAFSATEAAKAQAELAKAGLATSDILGGALSGSLALASAGSLDLAESADIAAKTMNVFQLEGKDVGHIADVLAAAANKSATDVHEMGEALRMGGLAANSAGMSLEETVGTLSAFADRALVGSDAGTSLKTMLQMLAAPSEKAANLMERLGIHAYDLQGNFIGTTKLAAQLRQSLGNLTMEQRNAALATIFGADAMRAANVLFEVGEQGIKDYTAAVDDQGAAAEVAAKKMDNLAGDVEKLKGSLETMAIEAGSGANSGLRTLVQMADALVAQLGALPPVVGQGAAVLAGVGGAALLAVAGMLKMKAATASAVEALENTGPAGQRAARGLEATSKWATRAGAAFAALQVAGAVLATFRDGAADVDRLNKSLEEYAETGKIAGETARVFGAGLADFGEDAQAASNDWFPKLGRSIEALIPGTRELNELINGGSWSGSAERIEAVDQALAQMVQTVGKAEAIKVWNRLLSESGMNADELLKLMPGFEQALKDADKAAGEAGTAIGGVGTAAGQTAEEVQELKDAFDRLFGIQMDLDRAIIAYREGLAELNEELRTGKRTLDTNTKAGRDNASALLDQVDNIKALRDANIDNGMSMADADAQYQRQIAQLVALGIKLGYDEQQVRDLIGAYGDIPEKVDTKVAAPGADTAKQKAKDFNFAIKAIPNSWQTILRVADETAKREIAAYKRQLASISRTITTGFNVDSHGNATRFTGNRWGDIEQMASGGRIPAHTVSSPTVLYGERATGEEAYIPKYGDLARSRGIWEYVGENWLGMNANGGGYRTMMAPSRVEVVARWVGPSGPAGDIGRALSRFIQMDVWDRGSGDVQRAYGKRA